MSRNRRSLERNFEGELILSDLLKASKCELTVDEVIEEFRCGVEEGSEPSDIIPLLWEGEPRFPNPDQARRTFANLFGLWDEIHKAEVGELITLLPVSEVERPLTPEYTELLWNQLEQIEDRDFRKLQSRFENQADGLGQYLNEQLSSLSAQGLETSFLLAFECWCILDMVEDKRLELPPYQKFVDTQSWLEDGNVDGEPALGHLVKSALWEDAAEEHSLPTAEFAPIEQALRVVRNAIIR